MKKFYVTSICYPIGGGESPCELGSYKNEIRFFQHFERAFETLLFDTELDALNFVQTLYPDRKLTVLEDTGQIVSTWGHESGLTSMKIKKGAK